MNKLIPNSFQHPNLYIDRLAYFLTPAENVVLTKAIREILGWQDKIEARKARIALSIFADGKFDKVTGKRLCYGCGLSRNTIRQALAALDKFNILVKEGSLTQDGQLFRLVDDPDVIDWAGLSARKDEDDKKNARRTEKATRARLESRGVTSDVRGNVDCTKGVTSDDTQGVTSDDTKETHEKPNRNPENPVSDFGERKDEAAALADEVERLFGPKPERQPTSATGNWAIPVSAGGSDSPAERLADDICRYNGLTSGIDTLPEKKRTSWVHHLSEMLTQWGGATVEEVKQAWQAWRKDYSWHDKCNPFYDSFETEFGPLLAEIHEQGANGGPKIIRCYDGRDDGPKVIKWDR